MGGVRHLPDLHRVDTLTDTLDFVPGDAVWTAMRKKGLSDLYYFASVICRYGDRVPITEPAHKILCKIVERKTGLKALDEAWVRKFEQPRGTGKCSRLNDLVLTRERGYVRADDLLVGLHVLSMDEKWQLSWQPIIGLELQPATPIHEIHFRSGRRLGVSGNHPLRMLHDWRRADEIAVGDRVATPRTIPEPPNAPSLPEEAAWLGYMVGDGNYASVRLTNADPAVLADFTRVTEALGGTVAPVKTRTAASELSVRGLRSLLREHTDMSVISHQKQIPAAVWRWDNKSLAAFLRALFSCDGSVERQGVSFSTVSDRLVRDVQRALLRFGVPSQVRIKRGRYAGAEHLSWRLNITSAVAVRRFLKCIGFTGARSARLEKLASHPFRGNPNRDTVPVEWRSLLPKRKVGVRDGNGLRLTHGIRIDNAYATSWDKATAACAAYGIPTVAAMRDTVYWDEVDAVRVLPSEPVMAVEVANTHVYCVEDIVTHNTTVITQAHILQRICRNPNISILLVNEVEKMAIKILGEIKNQIETNELLRTLYPEIIPTDYRSVTWSATAIEVNRTQSRKEPTVFVSGVGGALAGNHPDYIFVDDMLSDEAMESARSGSVADLIGQTNRWIHRLVPLLSGATDGGLDFIGTRWWYGDSYEHLEEAFGYGQDPQHFMLKAKVTHGQIETIQQLPAYRVGDIAVFRRAAIEDGQAAFASLGEEKFGLDALAKFAMRDPELFAANMMNEPANEATATFKESWLRFYDFLDGESGDQLSLTDLTGKRRTTSLAALDVLAFVDPGGFGKGKGGDRARAAVVVTGSLNDSPLHLILDVYSEKGSYVQCQKAFIGFVRRYGVRKAYVERAGQQLVFIDQLRDLCRKEGLSVIIEEVTTGVKSKDDRILGLEEPFQRATIYVGRGPKFLEFRQQLNQFPKATRKDILDALSMAPGRWRKVGGAGRQAAQRQQSELASYYARRNMNPGVSP